MTNPYDDDRGAGASAGNGGNAGNAGSDHESTTQWRPVEGQAWSESKDAFDRDAWAAPPSSPSGERGRGRGHASDPITPSGGFPASGATGGFAAGSGYSGGPGSPGGFPGGSGYPGGAGYPAGPGYPGSPAGPGAYPPPPPPKKGNGGLIAGIIIAVLALIAAGSAIGYFVISGDDDGGSGQTTAQPTDSPTSTTTEDRRAENFTAPANWTKCGGSGEPGNLDLYYVGNGVTSCPFARAVRDSFVDHYYATDQLTGSITAYSSVTGRNYTMTCTDDGDSVTCTGGNNAVVHIV